MLLFDHFRITGLFVNKNIRKPSYFFGLKNRFFKEGGVFKKIYSETSILL